jgi:hypothetical protein
VRRATVAAQLSKLTLAGQPRETPPHLAPGEEEVSTPDDGFNVLYGTVKAGKIVILPVLRLCEVTNIKMKVVYVENVNKLSNIETFT